MSSDARLSTDELVAIRETLESIFDTPVTISRMTGATDDGYGHTTGGTPTQVAAVNAFFELPSGTEMIELASRLGVPMNWFVSLPLGTDVAIDDELRVTATGETYTVKIVRTPESISLALTVIVGKVA